MNNNTQGTQDIIEGIIKEYYRQNGGMFGDNDLQGIKRDLKIMHNIQIEDRLLDRRVKDYMSSLFSGRGGRA